MNLKSQQNQVSHTINPIILFLRDVIVITSALAAYYYPSSLTIGLIAALPWLMAFLFLCFRRLTYFAIIFPIAGACLLFILTELNYISMDYQGDWTKPLMPAFILGLIFTLIILKLPASDISEQKWWLSSMKRRAPKTSKVLNITFKMDNFLFLPILSSRTLCVLLLVTSYFYGVIVQSNMMLDDSKPIISKTILL